MDFDFGHIPVPFRMQPGLIWLPSDAHHLTALAEGSALWHEKKAVLQAGTSRLSVPGFDFRPAHEAISHQAAAEGLKVPSEKLPLELAFEEDFAVIDGAEGTLCWMCICAPSHWSPEEKVGRPFAAVHAPVADNAALVAASQPLVKLVTGGERWERFVWTITPSGRFDQHPRRHAREPWAQTVDAQDFASRCFLRAERQTFFPVGRGTQQAVFTIRVMLQPLVQAVDSCDKARRLHDSLASMSPAVLAYKNLESAREPLLRWLADRAG